jgi:hypothetical protein
METNTLIAILGVAIAGIGLVITVGGPLIGFAYRTLQRAIDKLEKTFFTTIAEQKKDTKQLIEDEERRRTEAITIVTNLVNSHYEALRKDLADLKDDIKEIRNAE